MNRHFKRANPDHLFAWIDGDHIRTNELFYLESPSEAIAKNHKVNSSGVNQSRHKCRSTVNKLIAYHKKKTRSSAKPIQDQFSFRELEINRHLAGRHGENYFEKSADDLLLNLPYQYLASDENKPASLFSDLGVIFLQYRLMEAQHASASYKQRLHPQSIKMEETIGEVPWLYANELLIYSGIRYRIAEPPEVSVNDTYQLRFQSIDDSSVVIPAEDLSAGEQVIVGLVALFVRAKQFGIYPKMILMDEPDARLHSQLIPRMLNSIRNLLTSQEGCRVIMTTHRPETIVAAPQGSLVEVQRTPDTLSIDNSIWWKGNAGAGNHIEVSCRTRPVADKSELISRLTGAAFFIRKNFRFVLVEDSDDQHFYRVVYSLLLRECAIPTDPALVFQGADKRGKFKGGGCEIIKSILARINDDIADELALSPHLLCGLIDMDGDQSLPQHRGLHKISRYSLENYLFDPILVYSQLVDAEKIEEFGIKKRHNRGDSHIIRSASQEDLQEIASTIIGRVEQHMPETSKASKKSLPVSFVGRNDIKINYPEWLFLSRGKDISSWYASAFSNYGGLGAKPLIERLEHLRLIPTDLHQVFERLMISNTSKVN